MKDADAIEAIRQTCWTSPEGKYKVESERRTKRRLTVDTRWSLQPITIADSWEVEPGGPD